MAEGAPEVEWLLLSRYALMVSLCELIPVPLVDGIVANLLRRRLVGRLAREHGVTLDDEAIDVLGTAPGGGCLGCALGAVLWPFKKLLRTFFFVLMLKKMVDEFSDVVHRGLMLHEAFEQDWLPGDAGRVRKAMDTAVSKIDIRLVERTLLGTFRDGRDALNQVVHDATSRLRAATADDRARELAEQFEQDGLPDEGERMSRALAAALQGLGTAPEAITWFREEMRRSG